MVIVFTIMQPYNTLLQKDCAALVTTQMLLSLVKTAIVLGAGASAEELLKLCQKLEDFAGVEVAKDLLYEPESNRRAYIPILSLFSALTIMSIAFGVSTLRTHKAWVVNGTLRQYTFLLDGEILYPTSRESPPD